VTGVEDRTYKITAAGLVVLSVAVALTSAAQTFFALLVIG
jgi:hypothetical protein